MVTIVRPGAWGDVPVPAEVAVAVALVNGPEVYGTVVQLADLGWALITDPDDVDEIADTLHQVAAAVRRSITAPSN
jgi:hypothetical protein